MRHPGGNDSLAHRPGHRREPARGHAGSVEDGFVMEATNHLPWCDLGDLYPGPNAPSLFADLDEVGRAAEAFRERYSGCLAHLATPALLDAVRAYERLAERAARLVSYATLLAATGGTEPLVLATVETIRMKMGSALSALTFFPRELVRLGDGRFEDLLRTPGGATYAPWLGTVRAVRGHLLTDAAERQLAEESAVQRMEWVGRYDRRMHALRVPTEHGSMSVGAALRLHTAADPTARESTARTLATTLDAKIEDFTLILNALIERKQREDRRRGFDRPDTARNCVNRLGDEVVDAMLDTVRARAPLAHRFYRLKAGWLGRDVLDHWDRSAPLPSVAAMRFEWEEAKAVVLQAFESLSPEIAALAGRFFEEGWIDAAPRDGKVGGSACYATVPCAHPYIVMSYRGTVRDVLALAHELAHGVHQMLAADNGFLAAAPPPVLAETVAALAEIVVLDGLCQQAASGPMRDALLALKLEHLINTIFHHAAIHEFERRVHHARPDGELTSALVNELWLGSQRAFMGPVVRLDPCYGSYWTCVGHVFRAPFYAYSYVFGGALALSLHGRLAVEGQPLVERYVSLLRLGGRAGLPALTALLDTRDRVPSAAALATAALDAVGSLVETLESKRP